MNILRPVTRRKPFFPFKTRITPALASGIVSFVNCTMSLVNMVMTPSTGGSGTLTYQWRRNTSNIGGATSLSLADSGASFSLVYSYDVVTTDGLGQQVTSAAVNGSLPYVRGGSGGPLMGGDGLM